MPTRPSVAIRDLSYTYEASREPLLTGLSAHFPAGFTGIVGANGAGKTTLLKLLIGELKPDRGVVEGVTGAVYCAQRTDDPPATFPQFLEDWSGDAWELRGRLEVDLDFLERWPSLSHGERKRAQIAHALWQSPTLLAIDEPTNHIDADARQLLLDSLRSFRGVGLIVSHDRELLDTLCCQCVWLEPPAADVYPGGFSQARELRLSARESATRERAKLKQESRRLKREVARRREKAAGEHRVRSKRGLGRKDSDAREKIDRARVTDGGAGSSLKQLEGRASRAQAQLENTAVTREYETGIWVSGSRSPRKLLLSLPAGETQLGDDRRLRWPEITIRPDDRIAITGPNGAGKSTLLQHVIPLLNVPQPHTVFLPQEVTASAARDLLDDVRSRPSAQLGTIMNIVSRLNSRPERLLESRQPSPGEVRKLLLATGISETPHIIVMDEPTNHLDLPSIEALEQALADCPCALLLVSHDCRFIDGVGAKTWSIERDNRGNSRLFADK